ncbi:Hypothetical predicted protein [Cloeon dipterum]|uniref:Uncharacterized protein n=1 Tax=Cloeon dipterum TaxID=197152 RepID=A0A8S1CJK1_9INSE|nr:Hypothetical predicted protein [Cloeon dipterum]
MSSCTAVAVAAKYGPSLPRLALDQQLDDQFSEALCRSFSSKGKDPKTTTVTVTVPRGAEKNEPYDEHTNWELLGRRGYKFILPGSIGLSPAARRKPSLNPKKNARPKKSKNSQVILPDTNHYRQVEIVTQLAVLAAELNSMQPREFKCKAVDCPFLLREQVIDLFPRDGLGYGPLTAVCVALRSPESEETKKDWEKVFEKFEETARRVCGKLKQAGFWAGFPAEIEFDMSKLSTDVSPLQIEATNMLRSPAPRLVHVSGYFDEICGGVA